MKINIRYWLNFSLVNLLIVAFLGLAMRYKIGFEFPYFNQKNIQHAHSHFAFLGWITHTLFVLIIYVLFESGITINTKNYRRLIIANLVCAYGMLVSFNIQGYGMVSIILSSLAIGVNYVFAYYLFKDVKRLGKDKVGKNWFKAALLFSVISSFGTFSLAYMMASKNYDQNRYLASVYFYLHFQYNGFFTFACMGLLLSKLRDWLPAFRYNSTVFWLFFLACIPAYFLSILWADLPVCLYVGVVIASFSQMFAWGIFLVEIRKSIQLKSEEFKKGFYVFLLVAAAFTVKLLLQLGSTIPVLSKLAFGFRPIVIAYLHLILLAVISVFLLNYIYTLQLIHINKTARRALIVFVTGVFLNEIVLAFQGIASFSYTIVPYVNEILFAIAVLIFFGIFFLVVSQRKSQLRFS
jgi:hypothetical protein